MTDDPQAARLLIGEKEVFRDTRNSRYGGGFGTWKRALR